MLDQHTTTATAAATGVHQQATRHVHEHAAYDVYQQAPNDMH